MRGKFLEALAGARLYPLTDREISGLSHAQQISLLSDAGATLIQIREKTLSPLEFYREAAEALRVARERGVKVIINDRVDIALALKADGVHVGQDDLPATVARRLLGDEAIIGVSTHNLAQARVAAAMPVDYVAIGPIFATTTKNSLNPALGIEGLQAVRELLSGTPVVAIGGITPGNSEDVFRAGTDGVAVIGALWAGPGRLSDELQNLLHRA